MQSANTNTSLAEPVVGVQEVSKRYGAQTILDQVSITVHDGERLGLTGPNGAGKSTLLKIIAGIDAPDEGQVTQRRGLSAAYLEQQPPHPSHTSIADFLMAAVRPLAQRVDEYRTLADQISTTPEKASHRGRLFEQLAAAHHAAEIAGAWQLDTRIKEFSEALRLPPPERPMDTLSGGELRRVHLAARLIEQPQLLLLDEPTNHADVQTAQWLERFLAGYPGAVILVTHDRYFLDCVVTRMVEMNRGGLYSFPGNYERFLERKTARLEHMSRTERRRRAMVQRELAWLRRGPKARRTKQKARIKRYEALSEAVEPARKTAGTFQIPQPRRLGKQILKAERIARTFNGKPLFQDFSFILQKDMRVGIVGPSGCGKTTLLRVLMGEDAPDAGRIARGESTEFLYVDQTHDAIDPNRTVLEHVSNGETEVFVGAARVFVPTYLEGFLVDKGAVHMPTRNLSGGERNRIELARKMIRGGNVLVLDEPTNDLDLQTLRVLEEAVLSFDGPSLIVSHDRYFLNRLCTHMLVFEDNGHILATAGNYDDYLAYQARTRREPQHAAASRAKPGKLARPQPSARRLTWKEQRELEQIEAEIKSTEREIADLEDAISRPGFYEREHAVWQQQLDRLACLKARAETLYERWAELER